MPFPATRWNVVDTLKGDDAEARSAALEEIITTYGPPLLAFALRRRRAKSREDCEDLVNDYFLRCIQGGLLQQADRSRGRFRNFLLTSFKHYVSNEDRAKRTQKRAPAGGLVSLDSLTQQFGFALEPQTAETPEAAFEKTLRFVLFNRALREFEKRCRDVNDELKYRSFVAREIEPARNGTPVPKYAVLAKQWDVTENSINKTVLLARTEFNELLREAVARDCETLDAVAAECRLILATVLKG